MLTFENLVAGCFALLVLACLCAALRESRYGFIFWFLLVATPIVLVGRIVSTLPVPSGPGPTAPLEGITSVSVLVIVCLLLGISLGAIAIRPKAGNYQMVVVVPTVIAYFAMVVLVAQTIPKYSARSPILVECLTIDEKPIAQVHIVYQTFSTTDGDLAPAVKGDATTDSSGHAIIFTRPRHRIEATLSKEGYSPVHVMMDIAYRFGFHQTSITWNGASSTNGYQDNQFAMVDVPATKALSLKLYLPRRGVDTRLPYPPYNPTWLPK